MTLNFAAATVIGINFGEFHLTLAVAAKSINASGWALAGHERAGTDGLFLC